MAYPSPAYRPNATRPSPRPGFQRPRLAVPKGMPTFPPIAANSNHLSPLARGIGFRLLPRLLPYVGAAIVIYEVYHALQPSGALDPAIWIKNPCGPPFGSATHHSRALGCSIDHVSGVFAGPLPHPDYMAAASGFRQVFVDPADASWYYGQFWVEKIVGAPAGSGILPSYPSLPSQWPALRPGEVPIHKPAPFPRPKRWRDAVAIPGSQPGTQPKVQPGAAPGTNPARNPRPSRVRLPTLPFPFVIAPPAVRPYPGADPVTLQPDTVVIQPGQPTKADPIPRPSVTTKPGNPTNRPPSARVKERKINVRSVAGGLWGVLNMATEGIDFVSVLHGALPKQLQAKMKKIPLSEQRKKRDGKKYYSVPVDAKMKAIYDNFQSIDVAKAVALFVSDQIEDQFYGRLSKPTQMLAQHSGAITGTDGAVSRAQKQAAGDDQVALPELRYDTETRTWSIGWGKHEQGVYKRR